MDEIPAPDSLSWKTADVQDSLKALRGYVETEAQRQIRWYYDSKQSKAVWSRLLRIVSIICFTAGGLAPIFKAAMQPGVRFPLVPSWFELGQSGYVLIALGAASIGFDKFFGFSSGWIRYITTAFAIEKLLEEFRFEWTTLAAASTTQPAPEQIHELIALCRQFSMAVKSQVEEETKAWVTEFQTNLAQLEKDLKARVETSKTEVQAKSDSSKLGAISITVTNGALAVEGFSVSLDDTEQYKNLRGNKAEILHVVPGMHKIGLAGKIADKDALASEIVMVGTGEITKLSVTLA